MEKLQYRPEGWADKFQSCRPEFTLINVFLVVACSCKYLSVRKKNWMDTSVAESKLEWNASKGNMDHK